MQPTENHRETAADLDRRFRSGNQHVPALVSEHDENTHSRWYARFLTTLAITAAGEEIIWAQMQVRDEGTGDAFFTVLTAQAVILGHATGINGGEPKGQVRVIGRKSLVQLEVHASTEIDREAASALAWPGNVQIIAEYRVPEKQVVMFVAYERESNADIEAPVLRLLAELQKDLNS